MSTATTDQNQDEIYEIRPRFRLTTKLTVDEVCEKIIQASKNNFTVSTSRVSHRVYVRIPETDRHYWSPELQIAVEEPEYDEDTLIRCVVGPRPAIWTMFVFFYFLIGVSTFFGGMYGLVQYSLDKESGWVWAFLVGGILISAIYLIAFFGRKKGQEQMVHLIHFASTAIGKENYTRL